MSTSRPYKSYFVDFIIMFTIKVSNATDVFPEAVHTVVDTKVKENVYFI